MSRVKLRPAESADRINLDLPFNSKRDDNLRFQDQEGLRAWALCKNSRGMPYRAEQRTGIVITVAMMVLEITANSVRFPASKRGIASDHSAL